MLLSRMSFVVVSTKILRGNTISIGVLFICQSSQLFEQCTVLVYESEVFYTYKTSSNDVLCSNAQQHNECVM